MDGFHCRCRALPVDRLVVYANIFYSLRIEVRIISFNLICIPFLTSPPVIVLSYSLNLYTLVVSLYTKYTLNRTKITSFHLHYAN